MLAEFQIPVVHSIDAMWCDSHGVFAKGWVHSSSYRIKSVSLQSGAASAFDRELHDRVDLLQQYPDLRSTRCGFSIYLSCPPFRPVFLEFETEAGVVRRELSALPDDHWLNVLPPVPDDPMVLFTAEMKARGGVVLEVGARAVAPGQVLQADRFRPECTFIGVDIHQAPGVDLVADAHFLSEQVPRASIDGLFSQAVMEHLASPWLFVGEINKVLKVGGLTLQVVPHSFPIHEVPNDFWRVSDDGLRILFSAETGFEVLASGMTDPVKMFVHPAYRPGPFLETALFDGMLSSFILARKVSDIPDDAIRWPVPRQTSFERGRTYPAHGSEGDTKVGSEPSRGITLRFEETGAELSVTCPACAAPGPKHKVLIAKDHDLYKCQACGSDFYYPFPEIDYTAHTPPLSLRDYVEMNASIDFPIRNILRLIPQGSAGRMLDVGCGYGFALDAVRTLTKWEVKGFEPSQYGGAGRDQLGVNIIQDFAVGNGDPDTLYDVVYCSEVIEHVTDPKGFLDMLVSYLAEDGILVLTSPNPDAIKKGAPTATLLALLSPGAHTILFNDKALSDLLRAAGLPYVTVEKTAETTLYYAARRDIAFVRTDVGVEDITRYYELVLRREHLPASLKAGIRYRLFRAYMDHGRYDLAANVDRDGLGELEPDLSGIQTLEQFAARWPLSIAASTYYCGMFELLSSRHFDTAAAYFRSAFALCRKKLDLAPNISVVEADLLWRARYHEALACDWGGRPSQARFVINQLMSSDVFPQLPKSLLSDVEALRSKLGAGMPPTKQKAST
jgi:SAM-dependent methyltransferase